MLYLEDYLEMIEHLPQELSTTFSEMREMDLNVQNNMDSLDKRVRMLFNQIRRSEIAQNDADSQFGDLRKDYYQVLEDADYKVQLANTAYDLVDRYLRRLDSELYKFKCELEADHNGITEILEKRSLEMDGGTSSGPPVPPSQKENRYFSAVSAPSHSKAENRHQKRPEKRRDSSSSLSAPPEKRQALSSSLSSTPVRSNTPNLLHQFPSSTNPAPTLSYNLGQLGAGNAIAAAASQAIAATTQMQQGRRTASLKASYEAINTVAPQDLLINRELAGAAHSAIQAVERETNALSQQRKHKKKLGGPGGGSSGGLGPLLSLGGGGTMSQIPIQTTETDIPAMVINENGLVVEQTPEGEWTYDPNEPRYCICNQVSYGDMVACDNEDCPFEWFHYPCVGITSTPKGKWYCPQCTSAMRRRSGLKKT